MALTIVVGVEFGAKRISEAKLYSDIGLQLSIAIAAFYIGLGYVCRGYLAHIYTTDAEVQILFCKFMAMAAVWQCGDSVAAPIQGILRGYKDVDSGFWSNVLAYWVICLPVGLVLDYFYDVGPMAYWQSLVSGVLCSALFMLYRLNWFQKRKLNHE